MLAIVVIWLFFLRVIRAVWVEMRPPRAPKAARPRKGSASPESHQPAPGTGAYVPAVPLSSVPMPGPGAVPIPVTASVAGALMEAGPAATISSGDRAGRSGPPTSEAKRAKQAAPGRATPSGLRVVDPEERSGTHYALGSELVIGRAGHCGVILDDQYTSSVHARVFSNKGSVWVEDMSSTNGTWVNAQRIARPVRLAPGDTVQVGGTVFEVE